VYNPTTASLGVKKGTFGRGTTLYSTHRQQGRASIERRDHNNSQARRSTLYVRGGSHHFHCWIGRVGRLLGGCSTVRLAVNEEGKGGSACGSTGTIEVGECLRGGGGELRGVGVRGNAACGSEVGWQGRDKERGEVHVLRQAEVCLMYVLVETPQRVRELAACAKCGWSMGGGRRGQNRTAMPLYRLPMGCVHASVNPSNPPPTEKHLVSHTHHAHLPTAPHSAPICA
jgi:hypothetical protein